MATTIGQTDYAPLGGSHVDVVGPGFHRLDFSLFKEFPVTESKRFEFRAEFFNITNHPNFALPGGRTFSDANFGQITSTRDNPNDPREIQVRAEVQFLSWEKAGGDCEPGEPRAPQGALAF